MFRRIMAARIFGMPAVVVVGVLIVAYILYRRHQGAAAQAAAASSSGTSAGTGSADPYALGIDGSGAGVDNGLTTSGGYPSMYPVPIPGPTGPAGPAGPAGPGFHPSSPRVGNGNTGQTRVRTPSLAGTLAGDWGVPVSSLRFVLPHSTKPRVPSARTVLMPGDLVWTKHARGRPYRTKAA